MNYGYSVSDDNGTVTFICAKSRTEAIEIYCRQKGCPKDYVKNHCVIRIGNQFADADKMVIDNELLTPAKRLKGGDEE